MYHNVICTITILDGFEMKMARSEDILRSLKCYKLFQYNIQILLIEEKSLQFKNLKIIDKGFQAAL